MSRRNTGPTAEAVALVVERDRYTCVRCGHPVSGERGIGWSVQHRIPRGMGGSRDPRLNLPSNLIILCGSGTTQDHGWVESNRTAALAYGWSVSRHADPAEIPVLVTTWPGDETTLPVIEWRLLDNEGSYQVTEAHHA